MAVTTNVPSDRFEDLQRDVQDATRFVNQTTGTFTNRVGSEITPIPVRDAQYNAAISNIISGGQTAIANTGFFPVAGSFEAGGTITERNQYLQLVTTVGGDVAGGYSWGGALPKVVPPGSTPATTGGTPADGTGWVYRGDATVRADLADGSADISGETAGDIAETTARNKLDLYNASQTGNSGGFWEPEAQPNGNAIINTVSANAADFYALWDGLLSSHPSYISKTNRGADESGLYNLFSYAFTPENGYENTVIILCNTHGGEIMGQLATYLFFKQVCDNFKSSNYLAYARNRIRWVVMPICNPWGISQSPRSRPNSNGVDINRNFNYRWAQFVESTDPLFGGKGSAPFSENESVVIRDLVEVHYPDAKAVIDVHSFLGLGSGQNYIAYVPDYAATSSKSAAINIVSKLLRQGENYRIESGGNPATDNYFASTGRHSLTPEWALTSSGGSTSNYDSADMTQATRWFGNVLLEYASLNQTLALVNEPFAVGFAVPSVLIGSIPTGSFVQILPEYSFTPACHGIVSVSGFAVVDAGTGSIVSLRPRLGQDGHRTEYRVSSTSFIMDALSVTANTSDRVCIPFQHLIPCLPGATVRFYIEAASTVSAANLRRFSAELTFTPTSAPVSVKHVRYDSADPSKWYERQPNFEPAP